MHDPGPLPERRYELVPVGPLFTLDLFKSLKSQVLSPRTEKRVDVFLKRHSRLLFIEYLISLALSISMLLVSANAGRAAALGCFICGLPLALGSVASLRYGIVRLLCRKYDFWFHLCANGMTYVMLAAMFRDLRVSRVLIDIVGFQNIVLVDAQLLGVRHLIMGGAIAILTINVLLVCVMLNTVDEAYRFLTLHYKSQHWQYNMTVVDVVGNGLVTMTILLLKIVYRKRTSLKRRLKATRGGAPHIIECAIYRVSVQLAPCTAVTGELRPHYEPHEVS